MNDKYFISSFSSRFFSEIKCLQMKNLWFHAELFLISSSRNFSKAKISSSKRSNFSTSHFLYLEKLANSINFQTYKTMHDNFYYLELKSSQ